MKTLKPDNEDRKIEIQEPNKINILIEKRDEDIIDKFKSSIDEIKNNLDSVKDCESILYRSSIVLAVSAMDYYIHEIVKYMTWLFLMVELRKHLNIMISFYLCNV